MHLLVNTYGSKYWRMKYCFAEKEKMLSIGVYPDVSLVDANDKRNEARNYPGKVISKESMSCWDMKAG